jgi:hypothetical protein
LACLREVRTGVAWPPRFPFIWLLSSFGSVLRLIWQIIAVPVIDVVSFPFPDFRNFQLPFGLLFAAFVFLPLAVSSAIPEHFFLVLILSRTQF